MTHTLLKRLPHKPPALLLADVLEVGDGHARCTLAEAVDPTLGAALLPAPLALEAMAQAAAVCLCMRSEGPLQGMLVQCRRMVMQVRSLDLASGMIADARMVSASAARGLYQFEGTVGRAGEPALVSATFLLMVQAGAR